MQDSMCGSLNCHNHIELILFIGEETEVRKCRIHGPMNNYWCLILLESYEDFDC